MSMDNARFDAWTRRAFGVALGALPASLFARMPLESTEAKNKNKQKKKRKRNKRCKKVFQGCNPAVKKKRCCKGLSCEIGEVEGPRCCRPEGSPCTDASQCCGVLAQCLGAPLDGTCGSLLPI